MAAPYINLESFFPFKNSKQSAENVLKLLYARLNFDLWMITKVHGNDWIVLAAEDHGYGVKAGDIFCWSDSFCYRMTRGLGPYIAPDTDNVPVYSSSPIAQQLQIKAYVGIPLIDGNGALFGTLCGIHPEACVKNLEEEFQFLTIQARLISTIINAEQAVNNSKGKLEKEKQLSQIDELTGVYNRRGWNNYLEVEEQRCQRYNSIASVIFLDLDDLKLVNDSEGHVQGDKILRKTALCLLDLVRPFDVVCRYGGDEFVILVIETSEVETGHLLNRVRKRFKKEKIKASLGWATKTGDISLKEVTELADRHMYEEKRKKR